MTTNIAADHRVAFEALVSGDYCNVVLFSCFVNGEPGASDCRCKPGLWRLCLQAAVRERHAFNDAHRSCWTTRQRCAAVSGALLTVIAHNVTESVQSKI